MFIEAPVNLKYRKRELLEELDQSIGKDVFKKKKKKKGFFDGVKKFFDDLTK